jgi:hypothetical protein
MSGSITLGKEPAVGYQVELHSNSAAIPARTEKEATATAVSDDEGHYEATVWLPGDYFALATTAAGIPAAGKQIQLEPGENALDFELDGAGISGLAVDEAGKPVEGAGIIVRWRGERGRGSRVGRSGADGMFHFPMLDSAHVAVEGHAKGYKPPPAEEVEFVAGVQPPPVRLVFTKEPAVRGELRTAGGQPVADGWVALFASFPEAHSSPSSFTRTDSSGRFEISSPGERASRGFASGPGCPLVSFALAASEEGVVVDCPAQPAALSILIRDENNEAVANARVILLRDGALIPWHALATHLGTLGLPAASDAYGRLTLAALAPGEYRAFLLDATSAELIRSGSDQGFLGSFLLRDLEHSEVEVEIDRSRLPKISGQ